MSGDLFNTTTMINSMHESTESLFIQKVMLYKAQNAIFGRWYETWMTDRVAEELRKSMTTEDAERVISMILGYDVRVGRFVESVQNCSAVSELIFEASCKPLMCIFILAYFCPERPSEVSLLNYCNVCGKDEKFQEEIMYLYLLRINSRMIRSVPQLHRQARERLACLTSIIDGGTISNNNGNGNNNNSNNKSDDKDDNEEKNYNSNDPRKKPKKSHTETYHNKKFNDRIPEVLADVNIFGDIRSQCPLATHESNIILRRLVMALPFMLANFDNLILSQIVRPYCRIAFADPELHPKTPVGLFVHLLYMTPTHLRIIDAQIMRDAPSLNHANFGRIMRLRRTQN